MSQAFVMIGKCMIEVGYENLNIRVSAGGNWDERGIIKKVKLSEHQLVTFKNNTRNVDIEWLEVV